MSRFWRGNPYPDDEAHWVTIPAELICLATALAEPAFAAENQKNIDAAQALSKPTPRKKK